MALIRSVVIVFGWLIDFKFSCTGDSMKHTNSRAICSNLINSWQPRDTHDPPHFYRLSFARTNQFLHTASTSTFSVNILTNGSVRLVVL